MIVPLAYALTVLGLLLAVWSGVWAGRRKPANQSQLIGCLLLEAGLAVQSVIAVAQIIGGADVVEPATFIAYALGILAPLALGFYIGRIEKTRWGSLGVCFTAVVVAVMTLRLLQLWRMGVTDV